MTPETIAIVTASLAIGGGLVKVIEMLVGKLKESKPPTKLDRLHDWTKELHRWHDVRDSETGTPLWYTDRRLAPAIEKLATKLDQLAIAIERMK